MRTLDNQIDTTTGTLKLRAMFANPDELLYPNQFVNARLLVNTHAERRRACRCRRCSAGAPGTYVYVINANNTVSVRPVKLGPTDGGYEAVLSGLQPGEKVVTDGTDRLRDGAKVTVPPPAQPQGAGHRRRTSRARRRRRPEPGQAQAEPGQQRPARPARRPPPAQ